jgi:putative transposase
MIDREHDLSITKQAAALNVSRGSVYYLSRPVSASDLEAMRRLDRLHLQFPFAGSRMLRGLLTAEGCKIGRRHVKTLMKQMGIEALYRRPRTTKCEPGHKSIRICCAIWRSRSRTRYGQWTSPTSQWPAASSIWRSCSTGSAAGFYHDDNV